jgi:hypothetical protein
MPEESRNTYIYRVLRYTPNLVRDEWVNIGIVLQDRAGNRVQARLIEETAELARVRRLHPNADEHLLRALPGDFSAQLGTGGTASAYLEKLEETLSNVLQLSPRKAVLAEDFDAEMDRLYHDHVSPPHRARTGAVENTLGWIRMRISDAFRRHRIHNNKEKVTKGFRVEEFTEKGDPFKLDYQYRINGTRGYVHALSLGRDPAQAKVLAYTAERIRAKQAASEFAAITEVEPGRDNPRHQFVERLLAEQQIQIVPLNRIEAFAEQLRTRLN